MTAFPDDISTQDTGMRLFSTMMIGPPGEGYARVRRLRVMSSGGIDLAVAAVRRWPTLLSGGSTPGVGAPRFFGLVAQIPAAHEAALRAGAAPEWFAT